MSSQPWIRQVGQVCMATLCKIGGGYCFRIECATHDLWIYANSLTLLIMNSLMTQRDLKQKDLTSKLVCLNVDGLAPSKALDQE